MKKHHIRGITITSLATLALAVLMFLPRFLGIGIATGFVLLIVMTLGVLDFFGAIEIDRNDPKKPEKKRGSDNINLSKEPGWLKFLAGFDIRIFYVGLALLAAAACRTSVAGTMGAGAPWSGPLLFVLGIAAIIVAKVKRRPFDGDLHEGFLVFSLATATIMATLGSQGLWDCWETHYGEVARRQLEQDDWISLFWQDEWFYSKPILIFWIMNLGMALFAVNIQPDEISSHAEWGVRFFVAALAIAVIMGVYSLLARRVSKRSGMFAALALGTMPLFGFMARQAITDLPFVGFMTLGVVFFLLGVTADPSAEAEPTYIPLGRGRRIGISGFHLLILGYILAAVPQFTYLATRNDRFMWGSLGRGDLKTVDAEGKLTNLHLSDLFDVKGWVDSVFGPQQKDLFDISLDWFIMGAGFALLFAIILFTMRRERRISRLCYHATYICLAFSVMAKGLGGFAMPLLGLIGFWAIRAPWTDLKRPWRFFLWHWDKAVKLDLLRGIPMFLFISVPWYLAMTVRHSNAFINRFFIHDHLKRLSSGVHGETGTFEYMVQQFGYAAFPWAALLPFALLAWPGVHLTKTGAQNETVEESARRKILEFSTCWALFTFTLLAVMVTKFHHYTFPLLPAAALLIGLFLDDVWCGRIKKLGAVIPAAMVIIAVVARDLIAEPEKAKGVLKGYAQLVGLFIYKYSRPYPEGEAYDFSKPLLIFSIIFVVLFAAWLIKRRRKTAMVLTFAALLTFSHWLNQHYMVELAPHWTQKHIIDEYYARRNSPLERLVAFQMNWKGENFYTGNRVVVYVSTKNKDFEKWVDKHRGERHFFITEHARYDRMSQRANAASGPIQPLKDTCNKYKAGWADKL